jgi:hypothetical protein
MTPPKIAAHEIRVECTPGILHTTDQIFGRVVVAGIGVAPLVLLVESSTRSISTS